MRLGEAYESKTHIFTDDELDYILDKQQQLQTIYGNYNKQPEVSKASSGQQYDRAGCSRTNADE